MCFSLAPARLPKAFPKVKSLAVRVVFLGITWLLFSASICSPAIAQRRLPQQPNVIILLADDLGYGEIGPSLPDAITTPNITRLIESGVYCSQGYVTAPHCSPSRAGLLTGRVGTRFGYEFNPIGARNEDDGVGLPKTENTIANVLRAAGYATGLVGKWHLGGTADFHPQRHGFDEFYGFLHEGHFYVQPPWEGVKSFLRRKVLPGKRSGIFSSHDVTYSTHLGYDEPPYDANNPILQGSQPVQESEYLTDAFTREGVGFIQRHADRPFFLMMSYNAVHSPMQATAEDFQQHAAIKDPHRRIFAGMLSSLDRSIGQILTTLDTLELRQQTLVFFLSDNGGPTRELTSNNLPLRGEKGQMYEGGLRVPFVISWPSKLAAGGRFEMPVSSLDILPTAAAAGYADLPGSVDGVNLMPYLLRTANGVPHAELFWRQGKKAALRQGDWKIVNMPSRGESVGWELYDVSKDVSESNDLSDSQAERAAKMRMRWESLNAEMRDSLWPESK